jgi:hypothetical protein
MYSAKGVEIGRHYLFGGVLMDEAVRLLANELFRAYVHCAFKAWVVDGCHDC